MEFNDLKPGEWYQHEQHGPVFVAKKDYSDGKVLVMDDDVKPNTEAWVDPVELSEPSPSQSLPPSTTPQSRSRPTPRQRARVTCTFEITFPLPPTATQSQAKQYVADAVASHCGGYLPGNPMQDLDRDKIRVKLVRKTTFY